METTLQPDAWVMLIFGVLLLYGGLATFITIALRRARLRRPPFGDRDQKESPSPR